MRTQFEKYLGCLLIQINLNKFSLDSSLVLTLLLILFFPSYLLSAPGDVFFQDDFEGNLSQWTITNNGGNAGISSATSSSGSNSLYTRWEDVTVTSNAINTSTAPQIEFAIWIRRGDDNFSEDPDTNEDLVISYLDINNNWITLETFFGNGTPGEIHTRAYRLPVAASHNNFQVRIRQLAGDDADWDYWHIDDVIITELALTTFTCDDFENGLVNWTISSNGGNTGISGATFNSASNSLYTRWGDVTLTSLTVDTASFAEVEIKAWIQRGDDNFSEFPDTNENLVLSYLNASNNWIILETFTGGGTPGAIFDRTYTLPASAIHNGFKLRIQQTNGSGANWDYWHIDDVCIQEVIPVPTGSCSVYFPDTLQGHDNASSVEFRNNSRVINDSDNILTFPSIDDGSGSNNSCNTTDCSITFSIVPALTLPNFLTTNVSTDISLNSGSTTIGPGGSITLTDFDNFSIRGSANVTFSAGATTYIIDNADFRDSSIITFNPGSYWFDDFDMRDNAQVIINGPVTIFINGHSDIRGNATINATGNAVDLAIVSYDRFHLKDNSIVKAALYITGNDVKVEDNTQFFGAISAKNDVELKNNGSVTYENIDSVQVGDLCGGSSSNSFDHIEISHDGSALTCADEPITIRACADAACSSVATTDIDVTLTATGSTSTWSQNPITIPANSSSGVTVNLTHRLAETITLDATASPVATNSVVCIANCDLTFSETGFILSLANHQSCTTPNLVIQAVRLSDTGTHCAPAYSGNQSVDFIFNYSNPLTGTRVPNLDSTAMAAASVTQNRSINFDATASASLSFEYRDAGQINVIVSDAGDNGLSTAQVTSIVTPAKLLVSTSDTNSACSGPDYGNCTAYKVAGTAANAASQFNLDISAACADNSVTPNFQLNGIALSSNLVAPSGGANASLGVTSANISTAGTVTVQQTVSEVGAFSISATAPSYLGQSASLIPLATSATIGRFIPDRFVIVDNTPLLADATCDFTYQDQPFDFSPGIEPEVTLTAVNSAGATTLNYGGNAVSNNDFWKLNAGALSSRSYSNQVAAFPGTLSATLGAVNLAGETNYDGTNTFTLFSDQLTYNKSAATPIALPAAANDSAFNATLNLLLTAASLTDSDGVFYDPDNNDVADDYLSSNITGTSIRWGRWFMANAFGSELQPLAMVAEAQYFDGNNFVSSSTDICTTTVTPVLSNYTANLSVGETILSQGAMISGMIPLNLSAPGNGNDGSVLVTLTVPAWMQYDYDGNSTIEDASATAIFGIFNGSNPIIIRRQQY